MGFEKFDEPGSGRGRNSGTDPMISLRKSGNIGINQAALEELFSDNEAAVMYYDEDGSRVGIKPVSDKDADDAAYSITKSDSGGTLAPKAFLRRYDLVPDVTTQYDPEWDETTEMVVLEMDNPTGTYGSEDDDSEE